MENEIQSTQEVTPPVLSPTKSKKTLLLVLLGLILVTISVYVGIQIGKRQVPNKQNVTVQPTTEPTQPKIGKHIKAQVLIFLLNIHLN